jgi:hypothetical protein
LKGQKRNNRVKTIDKLKALQPTEKEIKNTRDSILKLLRGPGMDSKESTPGLLKSLQIRSCIVLAGGLR